MRSFNLNVRHLQAFITVARLTSFTRAARILHVSQPALTKQVRQLEKALGIKLFDRDTRTVTLTRIGAELNPVVADLLRGIERVVFESRGLAGKGRGILRIAALPSLCSTILPKALARFRKHYPGVSVVLRDAVASRVVNMVKVEEVDFGVGIAPAGDPDIQFTAFLSDRMVVALPVRHPLLKCKSVRLIQLARIPLVLMTADSSVRKLVDGAFASIGQLVTPAYEAAYMSTAAGMVKAGLGATILPSTAIQMGELAGLGTRPISHPAITRELGVLERSARSLSPAAEGFLRTVRSAVSTA